MYVYVLIDANNFRALYSIKYLLLNCFFSAINLQKFVALRVEFADWGDCQTAMQCCPTLTSIRRIASWKCMLILRRTRASAIHEIGSGSHLSEAEVCRILRFWLSTFDSPQFMMLKMMVCRLIRCYLQYLPYLDVCRVNLCSLPFGLVIMFYD